MKQLAEQGGESLHRIQRNTMVSEARKTSLVKGDIDTLRRGWASSSPELRSLDIQAYCLECKVQGHWTRGCKVRKADDAMVEALICTEESRPEKQLGLLEDN